MLPVAPSGYRNLQSRRATSCTTSARARKDEKATLVLYDLDKQKETELGEANGYEISADGKKMLVGSGGGVLPSSISRPASST